MIQYTGVGLFAMERGKKLYFSGQAKLVVNVKWITEH